MTSLTWDTVGRTHRHGGYRIEPADGDPPGGWVLHADDPSHPLIASIDETRFASLTSAKAAAIHHRVLTVRRTKEVRHAILAVAGFAFALPAFALMGPDASTRRVAFFGVGLIVLFLALREAVGLLLLVFSDGWDYGYDRPSTTLVDRVVAGFAGALGHAPFPDEPINEPAVHVVPLDERTRAG